MRSYAAVAVVLLIAFAELTVVGAGAGDVQRANDSEITLGIAMQDGIRTFNPLVAQDYWSDYFIHWMFEGLTWQNVSNNDHIEPWAAEWFHHGPSSTWSGEPWADHDNNTDFLNWTVKLRDGIKWHDWKNQSGDERYVRSHDIIFSYRLIAGSPTLTGDMECLMARNPDGSVMYGKDIEANTTHGIYDGINLTSQEDYPELPVILAYSEDDGLTLHFRLHHPYSFFTVKTLQLPVVPERIWKDHISERFTWDDPKCLISFGMFSFGYWNRSAEKGRLNTFRDYFRSEYDEQGRQKPYIDAIIFKVYGTTDAAVMALTSGEVDYIAWSINPGFIDTISTHSNLSLVRTSDLGFFYIAFNMRKPEFGYAGYDPADAPSSPGEPAAYSGNYTDTGKPFRVAFAHIIDKQQIVSKFLQGFGSVGTSVVSPVNSFWYNPNIKIYDYDPAKAKDILDAAGYRDTDGNGIRELPDRGESEIVMMEPPSDYDPCEAQYPPLIQRDAEAIGLNFKAIPTNFGTIVQKIDNHDFDMYMLGWNIPDQFSSATAPCDFFASKSDGIGQNYPGYHNQSFDKLCDEFLSSPDIYAQRNLSYRMQEAIAEDVPYSVLYYADAIHAYNVRLGDGTRFDYYSMMNLLNPYPAEEERVDSVFSAPSSVISGQSVSITLYLYLDGRPYDGANVKFSAQYGTVSPVNMTSNGSVVVRYTAPTVAGKIHDNIFARISCPSDCEKEVSLGILILPSSIFYPIDMELSPSAMLTALSNHSMNYSISIYGPDGGPLGPLKNGTGVRLSTVVVPSANFSTTYEGNGTWEVSIRVSALNGTPTTYHLIAKADYSIGGETVSSGCSDVTIVAVEKEKPPSPSENPPLPPSFSPVPLLTGVSLAIIASLAVLWFFRRRRRR